ncbi:ladderlectin-like isoform X2 [Perca fluviatilis]|uniref:ladderlectin-like isoform X2 n=1 Tax=Perca fluviatilis TaxID=8168 RepID=UPI001962B9E6|nr:ladderlectin-like isoform X2 [Perca fluviatilis]
MKKLTVFALVCAMTALTGAAAVPEEKTDKDQTADVNLVKRGTNGGCSGGWTRFNDRCFFYIPKPMTWINAEKNCESIGGNLASVRNFIEYHELQRLIMTGSHDYKDTWIGGTDAKQLRNAGMTLCATIEDRLSVARKPDEKAKSTNTGGGFLHSVSLTSELNSLI